MEKRFWLTSLSSRVLKAFKFSQGTIKIKNLASSRFWLVWPSTSNKIFHNVSSPSDIFPVTRILSWVFFIFLESINSNLKIWKPANGAYCETDDVQFETSEPYFVPSEKRTHSEWRLSSYRTLSTIFRTCSRFDKSTKILISNLGDFFDE